MSPLPALVAHADWSTRPAKRWMAVARLAEGVYELAPPEPVGDTPSLLFRLGRRAEGALFTVGFDFPIGLPAAYAKRAGIQSFVEELPRFGSGRWVRFYELARSANDVSVHRPFYPHGTDGVSQRALFDGLGVANMKELLRECERGQGRPAACCLFWTLGGNQVGRAAISGWREVLAPALAQSAMRVSIWPFHGSLRALMPASGCIIVETYPAEAGLHIGLDAPGRGWSKRRQADRQRQGRRLLEWAAKRPEVTISSGLRQAVLAGFSASSSGEDQFDAAIGLASMLEVITGRRADGTARSPAALQVEGWIFGQPQAQSSTLASEHR
jgi:hypothetical protein